VFCHVKHEESICAAFAILRYQNIHFVVVDIIVGSFALSYDDFLLTCFGGLYFVVRFGVVFCPMDDSYADIL